MDCFDGSAKSSCLSYLSRQDNLLSNSFAIMDDFCTHWSEKRCETYTSHSLGDNEIDFKDSCPAEYDYHCDKLISLTDPEVNGKIKYVCNDNITFIRNIYIS